jgi:hypothetical protein
MNISLGSLKRKMLIRKLAQSFQKAKGTDSSRLINALISGGGGLSIPRGRSSRRTNS